MYMCVKIPPGDLNPNPYPHSSHFTSTYTCRVIIAITMCNGIISGSFEKWTWLEPHVIIVTSLVY